MNSQLCSRCTLETLQYVELECRHHLCVNCFDRIMKSEKIGDEARFKCEICLKSQRVSSLSHLHGRWGGMAATRHSTEIPRANIERLYCFTCNTETFTTHEYLRGLHKGHRVKTYPQALRQLQQSHLKSISILQHRSQQLTTHQSTLESHLKSLWAYFSQTQSQINTYYQRMLQKLNQKRLLLLQQVKEQFRVCSNEVTRAVDVAKNELVEVKTVLDLVKGFVGGTESIDKVVANKLKLEKCLEIKVRRMELQQLPRLEEAFDLEFHIASSLRLARNMDDVKVLVGDGKEENVPPLRRTVKLLQKVRNRLNMNSQLLLR